VSWTNSTGVSISGNSLTKTASTGWGNAGASSTQSIASGDGYVEVTASETTTARLFGFSHTDADQSWPSIDFGIDLDLSGSAYVFESGNNRGNFGPYATGDKFQVAIVGGVVKYKKNGTVFYTSSVTPTYPLVVDTALHGNGCTLSNVVLGSSTGSSAKVQWLVPDHLGTPRMIVDQTGTLANLKRHDYLPFGEELFAPAGGRSVGQGYAVGDGVRQQFTQKERDVETGLDYFGARYYASVQGRFTSTDPSRKSIKATTPQTWNRYNYTLNNPLRYVDDNGKWPTDTHNRIIERAFRTLDPKLVRHIQRGSESVDRLGASPRTLYESNAPQHAMTPGSKVRQMGLEAAKDWARNEATHFINENMSQAKDYYQKSKQTNDEVSKQLFTVGAFESFGQGAHTIMDGGSPAHRDFQVYDVRPYEVMGFLSPVTGAAAFAWDMKGHADIEARQPTDAEMNKMVDDLRMQFLNAFGKEAYEKAVPEEDRRATEERKKKQEQ
jgi:RHS repeat-associated protein